MNFDGFASTWSALLRRFLYFTGSRSNTMHVFGGSGAAFPDNSSTRAARKYGVNVIDAAPKSSSHC
jgi:hypothetical protein